MGSHRIGIVRSFDPDRALGSIESDDGTAIPFHSTAIADGSRAIMIGQAVSIILVATHGGGVEAAEVIKLPEGD